MRIVMKINVRSPEISKHFQSLIEGRENQGVQLIAIP